MDNLLVEVAKQVPALGVLAWIVAYFLKAMNQRTDSFENTVKRISADCHDARSKLHDILIHNSSVLGRTESTLDRLEKVLTKMNGGSE